MSVGTGSLNEGEGVPSRTIIMYHHYEVVILVTVSLAKTGVSLGEVLYCLYDRTNFFFHKIQEAQLLLRLLALK